MWGAGCKLLQGSGTCYTESPRQANLPDTRSPTFSVLWYVSTSESGSSFARESDPGTRRFSNLARDELAGI